MKKLTHHYACDCREEKVKELARRYLYEHHELKLFIAGFGKVEKCECKYCNIARELLKT